MSVNDLRMRQLIAEEAARIILDEGVLDYHLAKRKAADRLGAVQTRNLPRNTEIEAAVIERQRLFEDEETPLRIAHLQAVALKAMDLLERYSPRLVGSVLQGIDNGRQEITLHAFAESVEEVMFFLADCGVSYRVSERRVRSTRGHEPTPCIEFGAEDVDIDVLVFPIDGLRQAPLSPINGKPMKRASAREVEALMRDTADCPRVPSPPAPPHARD
ncbi:hypothetical protein SAMN05216526_0916 [Ectothiorhodosinus mongolicus]|uniref:Uncharacterized protein n=1 Tax=Ectothiorhodosinus mongolicus TaxID=233100 RepID=A0A1R3VUU5_9GAMM|nr:hypothetical protein [Ectothiorhodosinus mongolicus]ULX56865.1 hypothetical protein CKX93_03590 [Ectothiorhodosinus mongolicus]SIT68717.1 hypothetical protein SAMN05216526_0916 [Ectothiorhodosinus mongolicus]